jgi:Rrf2 family protein
VISQTADYALRAMLHLAAKHGSMVRSHDLADATQISQSYLSKVLRHLASAELVLSARGPHGGFALSRPPSEISVLQVLNAVEPHRARRRRAIHATETDSLPVLDLLDKALASIEGAFRRTSLAELMAGPEDVQGHSPRRDCHDR